MTRILDEKLSWAWLRTYVGSFGSLILGTLGQIASVLILARYLGAYQFGQLMTVVAVGQVGLNLCGIGAGEAMVRRVAREPAMYPRLLGHNLILVLGSGVVITAVLVAIIPFIFPDVWNHPPPDPHADPARREPGDRHSMGDDGRPDIPRPRPVRHGQSDQRRQQLASGCGRRRGFPASSA